jgi:RluA family pseudouridine synthase
MLNNIKVIFEDDRILVIDKPPGLLVTPTPKKEDNTLIDILNREYQQRGAQTKIYLCHRLDRETSGVMVLAKGKGAQQRIMQQFHQGKVKKKYLCFIQGDLKQKSGIIRYPIEGKSAVTKYNVAGYNPQGFSVVTVETLTGRTNQVRIHFKMLGHPLVGERKFAFGKDYQLKFRRAALHAQSIELLHPFSGRTVKFEAALAQDMKNFCGE